MVNDIFWFLECCYIYNLIRKELDMCEERMITAIIFHLCHHRWWIFSIFAVVYG